MNSFTVSVFVIFSFLIGWSDTTLSFNFLINSLRLTNLRNEEKVLIIAAIKLIPIVVINKIATNQAI